MNEKIFDLITSVLKIAYEFCSFCLVCIAAYFFVLKYKDGSDLNQYRNILEIVIGFYSVYCWLIVTELVFIGVNKYMKKRRKKWQRKLKLVATNQKKNQ